MAAEHPDKPSRKCVLHDALMRPGVRVEEIENLLAEFPESIHELDSRKYETKIKKKGPRGPSFWEGRLPLPLHTALMCGAFEAARCLLANCPDHAAVPFDKELPLHAVFKYHRGIQLPQQLILELIKAYPTALRQRDRKGNLPLNRAMDRVCFQYTNKMQISEDDIACVMAVFDGYSEAVKNPGKNVLVPRRSSYMYANKTPFEQAVQIGQLALVRIMSMARPEVFHRPPFANPLYLACDYRHFEVFRYILEKGPPCLLTTRCKGKDNMSGSLPIHIIAGWPYPETALDAVKLLVAAGSDSMLRVPSGSYPGWSRLSWRYGHEELNEDLPIHIAAKAGNLALVKYLADKAPETLWVKNGRGRLPIHHSNSAEVQHYLARAAPATLCVSSPPIEAGDGGGPLLHMAWYAGHFVDGAATDMEYFEFLLSHTPLVAEDNYGHNILHIALRPSERLYFRRSAPKTRFLEALLVELQKRNLIGELLLKANWLGQTPAHFLSVAPLDAVATVVAKSPPEQLRRALKMPISPGVTLLHHIIGTHQFWGDTLTTGNRCNRVGDIFTPSKGVAEESTKRIKTLVKACPELVLVRNHKGSLPFHNSFEYNRPSEVSEFLLKEIRVFDVDVLAGVAMTNEGMMRDYLDRFVWCWAEQVSKAG